MTFQRSVKINQWFDTNSEGDRYDWFWRFVEETEPFDAKQGEGDYPDELMGRGYLLGKDAAERPVFEYSTIDDDPNCSWDLHLYFIGYEENILKSLQFKLDNWLRKYPQGTEEEKKQSELKKQVERTEQELRNKQLDLIRLQQELRDSTLESYLDENEFGSFHTYFHMATKGGTEKIIVHYLRKALALGFKNQGMIKIYTELVEEFLRRLTVGVDSGRFRDHNIKLEDLLSKPDSEPGPPPAPALEN